MTRLAFTGPTVLTPAQRQHAVTVIEALETPGEVTTGGARGIDMLAAALAIDLWPDALHRVVVPAAPFDRLGVGLLQHRHPALLVVEAPEGVEPYRVRNNLMLSSFADKLVAFVKRHGEPDADHVLRPTFYRSGEWMTINLARRLSMPVRLEVLP